MKINSVSSPIIKPYTSESQAVVRQSSSSGEIQNSNDGIQPDLSVVSEPSTSDNDSALGKLHTKEADKKNDVINEELLKNSIEQANKTLLLYNKFIEREIHPVTKAVMYKLKDSKTNEVISEFPPKKIQDMIAKMWELAGLFIDEKA